jgi:hypothetical protein
LIGQSSGGPSFGVVAVERTDRHSGSVANF